MSELEAAVAPVATAFEALGIEYYLAGSVISSLFGVARATADVDVVAVIRAEHADVAFMRHWAVDLGITDLLERALNDVASKK